MNSPPVIARRFIPLARLIRVFIMIILEYSSALTLEECCEKYMYNVYSGSVDMEWCNDCHPSSQAKVAITPWFHSVIGTLAREDDCHHDVTKKAIKACNESVTVTIG